MKRTRGETGGPDQDEPEDTDPAPVFVIDLPMWPKQRSRRSEYDYRPALRMPPAPHIPGLPVAGHAAPNVVRIPPLPVAGVLYISRVAVTTPYHPVIVRVPPLPFAGGLHYPLLPAVLLIVPIPPLPVAGSAYIPLFISRTVLWPTPTGPVVPIRAQVCPL